MACVDVSDREAGQVEWKLSVHTWESLEGPDGSLVELERQAIVVHQVQNARAFHASQESNPEIFECIGVEIEIVDSAFIKIFVTRWGMHQIQTCSRRDDVDFEPVLFQICKALFQKFNTCWVHRLASFLLGQCKVEVEENEAVQFRLRSSRRGA